MKRYRAVTQEDPLGCGAACVASVAGCTYDQAVKYLPPTMGGYTREMMILGLEKAGYRYDLRKQPLGWDAKDIPVGAIVFLSRTKGRYKNAGHYLLRTPSGWMDPWFDLNQDAKGGIRKRLPTQAPIASVLMPGF